MDIVRSRLSTASENQYLVQRKQTHLDGHIVAALGGDDAVPVVVVDDVVVDRQVVRVVVRVKAVSAPYE